MKHMRHYLRVSALLLTLLFVLGDALAYAGEQEPEEIQILPPGEIDSGETIRVLLDGTVSEMNMSDYLQGVVRAEMPASFEQQALCAQAVAARTYTLYKTLSGGNHGGTADVCGDPKCCQAYLSKDAAAANWGDRAEVCEAKIENAVAMTDGQTILYGGVPILAVFHSSSAGQTKSAGEVWTQDLPYLRSVSSPEDGTAIPNYYSTVTLPADEFRKKFQAARPEAVFPDDTGAWVRDLTCREGSNVDTVTVGGVRVRGSEMRTIFSLRSASFELEEKDGTFTFYVTGYGHGVGMSQYGANALAREGKTWQEIVEHYYTDVTVSVWTGGLHA